MTPAHLDVRTVVILFRGDRLLLLRRAPWKAFAPNRWTGLGGKVEPSELSDLDASARREIFEETDLTANEFAGLRLSRVLTFDHPIEGLVCLLYYVAQSFTDRVPACSEGILQWVEPTELTSLDLIENTARVIPLLVADVTRPDIVVRCGVARYDVSGNLVSISWDSA